MPWLNLQAPRNERCPLFGCFVQVLPGKKHSNEGYKVGGYFGCPLFAGFFRHADRAKVQAAFGIEQPPPAAGAWLQRFFPLPSLSYQPPQPPFELLGSRHLNRAVRPAGRTVLRRLRYG
jgi:hypothetical protein